MTVTHQSQVHYPWAPCAIDRFAKHPAKRVRHGKAPTCLWCSMWTAPRIDGPVDRVDPLLQPVYLVVGDSFQARRRLSEPTVWMGAPRSLRINALAFFVSGDVAAVDSDGGYWPMGSRL